MAQAVFAEEVSTEAQVRIKDPNENKPKMKKTNSKMTRANTNVGIINKFILQFSRIEKAYREVEDSYIHIAQSKGSKGHRRSRTVKERMKRSCQMSWVGDVLKYLGFGDPICFSNEELEQIFDKKIDSDEGISFQRLLIGVGLCYFAKLQKDDLAEQAKEADANDVDDGADEQKDDEPAADEPTEAEARFETLGAGFEVVKKMFDAIDEDGSGEISVEEFEDSFKEICRDPELVKLRMDELDYNHDHNISFREFIFGISAWCGFNDEMSLDDADEDLDGQSPPTDNVE